MSADQVVSLVRWGLNIGARDPDKWKKKNDAPSPV